VKKETTFAATSVYVLKFSPMTPAPAVQFQLPLATNRNSRAFKTPQIQISDGESNPEKSATNSSFHFARPRRMRQRDPRGLNGGVE